MIGYIKGIIKAIKESKFLILCGNIGYYVNFFYNKEYLLNESVEFYTYTKFSNDDISLYAFTSIEAVELIPIFLKVNGVGIKQASKVISSYDDPFLLISKIMSRNLEEIFMDVRSVTKKTLSKMIDETHLVVKKKYETSINQVIISNSSNIYLNYFNDLLKIGYKKNNIEKAIEFFKLNKIPKNYNDDIKNLCIILSEFEDAWLIKTNII